MIATVNPTAVKPRRWAVAVRIALITALITVVSFALALLASIVCLMVISLVQSGAVQMANAYRYFALPVAAGAFVLALILGSRYEIRLYREQLAAWRRQQ